MSDRLQCPDCDGTGRQAIGNLELACPFCLGLGYVGDDNEPAEDRSDEPHPMRPIWEDPIIKTLTVCKMCLGAKKVINLSDGEELTGRLIEMPCPACTRPDDDEHQDDE